MSYLHLYEQEKSQEFARLARQFDPPGSVQIMQIRDYSAQLPPEALAQHGARTRKRLLELTTGRVCASYALQQLGAGPITIERGMRGEPVVRAPFSVSISHACDYAAAFASTSREAIGIDIERADRVSDRFDSWISSDDEKRTAINTFGPARWRAAMFGAKESVYKATLPVHQSGLNFHDVRVEFKSFGTLCAMDMRSYTEYEGFSLFFLGYVCTLVWKV
jgi:4'-phosphopantetheinyl transferase EntD